MPTITDSQPVSIRLENDQIEYLKLVAYCKSVAQGHKISYTDLIREAISSAYPMKESMKMSDIERICWTQVNIGVEKMKMTGDEVCMISQGGSRHPIGAAHTVALVEHSYAAHERGFFIMPVSVIIRKSDGVEETEDCILMSKKERLSPEEIRRFAPGYVPAP